MKANPLPVHKKVANTLRKTKMLYCGKCSKLIGPRLNKEFNRAQCETCDPKGIWWVSFEKT